jgi:hypothetical protein
VTGEGKSPQHNTTVKISSNHSVTTSFPLPLYLPVAAAFDRNRTGEKVECGDSVAGGAGTREGDAMESAGWNRGGRERGGKTAGEFH